MGLAVPPRIVTAGASIVVLVALTAGSAAAGTDTTEPDGTAAGTAAPGCAEITTALQAVDDFGAAFAANDLDTMDALLDEVEGVAADAVDTAPPEIAEAVATWVEPVPGLVAALDDVDLSDTEAVTAAVEDLPANDESTAAQGEVIAWAEESCGYEGVDLVPSDAPEPPDCDVLDAAAAAEAAGVDVDVTDTDGSADINLPGFWTKACSYGNGALSVATLSFNSLEDAQQFYEDNLVTANATTVEGVDLGSLPESTIITQSAGASVMDSVPAASAPALAGTLTVSVLEAPVPFSVSFTGGDVTPEVAVAAAEAVLAALPAVGTSEPIPSEPAATTEP